MSSPKTLSFSTATRRDKKTLVWLQHQTPSVPWWRWDGVVTSLASYSYWKSRPSGQYSSLVGIVLVEPETKDAIESWLEEVYRVSKEVMYVVLSSSCLQWKPEAYWTENYDNLFVLEGMGQLYPFLGGEWNGTVEDAIRMLGLLCRYHRVVVPDAEQFRGRCHPAPLYEMVVEEGSRPSEFVLVMQYYTASDKKRIQELRECLRRNVKNRWIDRVVVLSERDESVAWASFSGKDKAKVEQRVIGKRLTYADFFQEVIRRFPAESGANTLVALANADIYFGEELSEAWRIEWRDRAVCLLRWDDLGDGPSKARLFGPRPDSQDVWMFSASSIVERHWSWKEVDLPLGVPGCDNAILRPLLQQRFLLSNPALSLKTYHLHTSGVRTYSKRDTIDSSLYIHLAPTYLIDSKQEMAPHRAPRFICHEVVPFTIRSSSLSDEITYCTMLEKGGRFHWEPMVENYAFEPAIPVYTWGQGQGQGVGVTSNGLVYDLYRIYTGRAALQHPEYNYWSSAKVDIFTPLVSCRRMVALPVREAGDVFGLWSRYVLEYLSRYLRLGEEGFSTPPLSFWLPEAFRERLRCTFPSIDVSLGIPWEEGKACWAEEVVGFLPGPVGAEMGREEVAALRSACRSPPSPSGQEVAALRSACRSPPSPSGQEVAALEKRCVVWKGGCWTSETIQQWGAEFLAPRGWTVVEVSQEKEIDVLLAGASVMVWSSEAKEAKEAGAWLWCLPKGAHVAEGQEEQEIQGEAQHLAHVADLDARVFLFGRASSSLRMAEWKEKLEGTGWF